jgi:prophage tail gpP-like protein
MLNEFIIIADNYKFVNMFESVRIAQSMNTITGTLGFKTAVNDPNNFFTNTIKVGSSYIATINGFLVGSGFVDDITLSYNENTMAMEYQGRDKTSLLVDSSFVAVSKEWKNQNILAIINSLCSPFGITVFPDKSVSGEIANRKVTFVADEGQSVMDIINKLCFNLGILPLSMGDGKLTLTKGNGTRPTIYVLGEGTVLDANYSVSNKNRYSNYFVKGYGIEEDTKELKDYISMIGEAVDETILQKYYKPLVIMNETATNAKECADRAVYEANLRAGESRVLNYTVEGWTVPTTQEVWKINMLVPVVDKNFQIFKNMLISEVSFSYDAGSGYETNLKLVDSNMYSLNKAIKSMETEFDRVTKPGV